MNTVPVDYYVLLSAILFTIGAMGVLIRRNPLIIFMSIELMLNAANLVFVSYGRTYQIAAEIAGQEPIFNGQIFVFFVIAVAAAEVAVGLALIVQIFKAKKNINIDELNSLKG